MVKFTSGFPRLRSAWFREFKAYFFRSQWAGHDVTTPARHNDVSITVHGRFDQPVCTWTPCTRSCWLCVIGPLWLAETDEPSFPIGRRAFTHPDTTKTDVHLFARCWSKQASAFFGWKRQFFFENLTEEGWIFRLGKLLNLWWKQWKGQTRFPWSRFRPHAAPLRNT